LEDFFGGGGAYAGNLLKSSELAVLMLMGLSGGFLVAAKVTVVRIRLRISDISKY
jgi:hypothetical protein